MVIDREEDDKVAPLRDKMNWVFLIHSTSPSHNSLDSTHKGSVLLRGRVRQVKSCVRAYRSSNGSLVKIVYQICVHS